MLRLNQGEEMGSVSHLTGSGKAAAIAAAIAAISATSCQLIVGKDLCDNNVCDGGTGNAAGGSGGAEVGGGGGTGGNGGMETGAGGTGGIGGMETGGGGSGGIGGMETGGGGSGGIGGMETGGGGSGGAGGMETGGGGSGGAGGSGGGCVESGACDNGLLGNCYAEGTWECNNNVDECNAPVIAPTTETCDNKDESCNGLVDVDNQNLNVCSPSVTIGQDTSSCHEGLLVESDLSTIVIGQSTGSGAPCDGDPIVWTPERGWHGFHWDDDQVTLQMTVVDAFPGLTPGEDVLDGNGDYRGKVGIKCSLFSTSPTHQEQLDDYADGIDVNSPTKYVEVPIVQASPTLFTIALNAVSCPGNTPQTHIPF